MSMNLNIEKYNPINTKEKIDQLISELIEKGLNIELNKIQILYNIKSYKMQIYFNECITQIKKEKKLINTNTKKSDKGGSKKKPNKQSARRNKKKGYSKPIFKDEEFAPRYSSFDYDKIDYHKPLTLIPKKN
ncbi:MAG: hypothetical protein ACLVKO_04420 [Dysgonomonas sp.]